MDNAQMQAIGLFPDGRVQIWHARTNSQCFEMAAESGAQAILQTGRVYHPISGEWVDVSPIPERLRIEGDRWEMRPLIESTGQRGRRKAKGSPRPSP